MDIDSAHFEAERNINSSHRHRADSVLDEILNAMLIVQGNVLWVDGDFDSTGLASGDLDGSLMTPFPTYAAAAAVASSGEVVVVKPGTYAENIALIAGVDVYGFCGPRSNRVTFEGKITASFDGSAGVYNLYVSEATDSALELTGANATLLEVRGCLIEALATATNALNLNAVNSVVTLWDTQLRAITANANAVVSAVAGTLQGEQVAYTHQDDTSLSYHATGAGVVSMVLYDFIAQGGFDIDTGAQNPTTVISRGRITTGDLAAIDTASTNTTDVDDMILDSAASGGNAVVGAGVFRHSGLKLIGTADELDTALNAAAGPGEDRSRPIQNVRKFIYTEAAGAGARAITFAGLGLDDMPHTNYIVSITCEDSGGGVQTFAIATGTIATTGFTVDTGGNALFHIRCELIET